MRKVAYYLPNLYLDVNVELGGCKLKQAEYWDGSGSLIDPQIFGVINGTLIEVDGFSSGDTYCPDVNESIYRELEIIKFSYFSMSVSNHSGFVSNDTFQVFRIIEKNKDPCLEHKVCFSNGLGQHLISLDNYFESGVLNGEFSRAVITENDLKYYKIVKSLPLGEDDFMMISIFNKTRNLYSSFDFIDRVLFARMATEKLAKKVSWKLTLLSKSFVEISQRFVQEYKDRNEHVSNFYEKNVSSNIDLIEKNIEHYFSELKNARHALAHAGEQNGSYENICYFMAWFPVAFLLSFDTKCLTEDLALRTILLLAASSVDLGKWQEREGFPASAKRTVLESYEHLSRVIPIWVSKSENDHVERHLQGLSDTLNSKLT